MQRPHTALLLFASLTLAACTTKTETSERQATSSSETTTEASADTAANVPPTGAETAPATGSTPEPAEPEPPQAPAPKRVPTFGFQPGGEITDEALVDYHVVLSASVGGEDVGSMTMALWGDRAPITVRNFLRLVDEGFYDGLTFHRIIRDFMVQGGDPTGTGGGNSPYGTIKGEFSPDPDRVHDYGVLSMARVGGQNDSASCQFFICCDPLAVKSLDGQYATFGKITTGVATLEAIADVPCGGPQGSSPTVPVLITKAEVVKGPAPTGEEIVRPPIDLHGEPESIVIQHILISFAGTPVSATRTMEEAEALATELLERIEGGEDFETILLASSDDPVQDGDTTPGIYKLLNTGQRNIEAEEQMQALGKEFQATMAELTAKQTSGEITPEQAQEQMLAIRTATMLRAEEFQWAPRKEMVPGFGNVGFKLEVGEVGMATHDPETSPFGWHIIRRLE